MLSVRRILFVLLALAALTVLFVRSQVAGAEDDNRAIDAARHLRELDQHLDSDVLEAADGLTLDYDTLTATLREMNQLQQQLEAFSTRSPESKLSPYLTSTRERILEKEALVETFKSTNSVRRNALTYLPLAARGVAASAPTSPVGRRLRTDINDLLATVLRCTDDCNPQVRDELQASLDAITATRELCAPESHPAIDVVLRNGRVYASVAPQVETTVRSLLVARGSPYDDLYVAARDRRDAAIERANGYRVGLVALSIGLLIVIATMVVRLHRNAAALKQALVNLENEHRVVDEKQRELASLNQHLETRVDERTRELSGSREEYRKLLETTHAIPWGMAPGSLRFTYVGPQAGRILGHPLADWTREGFLSERIHPEDAASAQQVLEALSADGAQGELELRMISADRREVWLRGFVNTSHDAEGRPVRRGIFLDVTSRRMLEAELRSAQKLESLGRLSAGIAHEINTPIQFVADSVQFINNAFVDMAALVATYRNAVRLEVTPDERPLLASAAREADLASDTDYALENVPQAIQSSIDGLGRIAAIVKSLKEFSHPDRKEKAAFDLNANIRSTLTITTNEYKLVADVETDFGEVAPVICHGGEINQVILNLIVNAAHAIADATKGTSGRGRITVRTWQEGGTACVCVRDTGSGIPTAIHERIFDPFFTTKEVGRGTGQGLAIARKIVVDKHGGELTFETEPGRGTAFVVRLPIDGISATMIKAA